MAVPLAIAVGAVMTSIADAILPAAARYGSPWGALATGVGFLAATALAVG